MRHVTLRPEETARGLGRGGPSKQGSSPVSRSRTMDVRAVQVRAGITMPGRRLPDSANWAQVGAAAARVGRGAEAPEARGARNRRGAPRREAPLKSPRH